MIKMHVKLHEILKFKNATNPFGNHSYHTAFLNTKHFNSIVMTVIIIYPGQITLACVNIY